MDSLIDCATVQLDARGWVKSWNGAAQRIGGWSAREIVGEHFSRFYSPEDIDGGVPQHDLDLAASGRFDTQGWRLRKDGSRFWASVHFTAFRDSRGAIRGFAKLTKRSAEQTPRRPLHSLRVHNNSKASGHDFG
jgi:PAS domain S-box-containing protein